MSSFYLDTGTSYQRVIESYRYNAETVMGDFGSYLGLFLGWSILSLAGGLPHPPSQMGSPPS